MSVSSKRSAAARVLKLAEATRNKTWQAHEATNITRDQARTELNRADEVRLDAYHQWLGANERFEEAQHGFQAAIDAHRRASDTDKDADVDWDRAHLELEKYLPKRKAKKACLPF
jgi:hypothetical protein